MVKNGAKDLKKGDFELPCKDGTRKAVGDAGELLPGPSPNHAVVSRKDKATCVERILKEQQVWTSQGLKLFFLSG